MNPLWMELIAALARWARDLIVRPDVYGIYTPPGSRKNPKKVASTVKAAPTEDILRNHFSVGPRIGLHVLDQAGFCRFAVVDIDRHDDKGFQEVNEKAAIALYNRVIGIGFSAFLEDSNGRGGYKLWLIFKEPVPARWVRRYLQFLVSDWQDLGLEREPEIFPKQDELGPGKFGNFVRLPGKHHTLKHNSRIWDGSRWLTREAAARQILATVGSTPEVIPAEFRTEPAKPSSPPAQQTARGARVSVGFVKMLRSALAAIALTYFGDYERWLRLGMCLRGLGDIGLELWEEASQRCPKYRPGECPKKWITFDPSGELTYRTILGLARENGWSRTPRQGHQTSKTVNGSKTGSSTSGDLQPVESGNPRGASPHGSPAHFQPDVQPGLPSHKEAETANEAGGYGGVNPPTANGSTPPPLGHSIAVPDPGGKRPKIVWNNRQNPSGQQRGTRRPDTLQPATEAVQPWRNTGPGPMR